MLVYIVRHGESEAPAKGKGHATKERHLTPDGRRWAKRVVSVAEKELGFRPDLILSSPLARAKETAEIARDTLHIKSEIQTEECLLRAVVFVHDPLPRPQAMLLRPGNELPKFAPQIVLPVRSDFEDRSNGVARTPRHFEVDDHSCYLWASGKGPFSIMLESDTK